MRTGAIHPTIRVRDLLSPEAAHMQFSVAAGEAGLDKEITVSRIQKPGLALAGFIEYIHPGRVQILGNSEISFLREDASCSLVRMASKQT